ncbi:unnamed protein product [Protopolystoma xenopodis]|uniref:Uncharacterized protein n=1 Tax=Protopolystoma xenopodis TaxID=117903 RepID=A0A448XT83_9PLAT|nr:unnamed protein product [Protopolystoma xenopodis]
MITTNDLIDIWCRLIKLDTLPQDKPSGSLESVLRYRLQIWRAVEDLFTSLILDSSHEDVSNESILEGDNVVATGHAGGKSDDPIGAVNPSKNRLEQETLSKGADSVGCVLG